MRRSEFNKRFAENDEREKEEEIEKRKNRPILDEVIIGKNVNSLKEVPQEAYDKAKKIIIAEGIKEIPDDFLVCNEYIEEIRLPEGLERIGDRAFGDIEKIKNIDMPDSVREIGEYVFFRSHSNKIRLPKSVEKLGRRCIRANIEEIEIDENNKHLKLDGDLIISTDGKRIIMAFNLTGKAVCKIPEGVEHIEKNAFAGCKFENIILPESLSEIGEAAFRGCDISHLIVPDSISCLGFAAFRGCDIGELRLPCNLKRIEGRCFEHARIEELKLPDSVEYIGELAFYEYENPKGMNLPESLKEVGTSAFYLRKCHINAHKIPENIEKIGDQVFNDAIFGKNIHLHKNIKEIGRKPFGDIKYITLYDNLEKVKGRGYFEFGYWQGGCWHEPDSMEEIRKEEFGDNIFNISADVINVKSADTDELKYSIYLPKCMNISYTWGENFEPDFEAYDRVFEKLEPTEDKLGMLFIRLENPYKLGDEARKRYEDYLRDAKKSVSGTIRFIKSLIEVNGIQVVDRLHKYNIITKKVLDKLIERAEIMDNKEEADYFKAYKLS